MTQGLGVKTMTEQIKEKENIKNAMRPTVG